ncbi:MAG: hypothetical protein PHV85_10025, partial [Desulfovibrionaceae bacterium]|nr:hypothetical protein [Desulfovibrionaceae bacterium]
MGGALDYHLATAHVRGRLSARGVDWVNRPPEHKLYPGLPGLTLPRPQGLPDLSLARALQGPAGALEPDVQTLSNLLFLAWGVTAAQSGHSGEHQLRSAAWA